MPFFPYTVILYVAIAAGFVWSMYVGRFADPLLSAMIVGCVWLFGVVLGLQMMDEVIKRERMRGHDRHAEDIKGKRA